MAEPESPTREVEAAWRAAVLLVAGVTFVRVLVLFATPLELHPDEAQYWLWSRELAFGYYSKPPLIAWAIRATTAIGGDTEPWIRLSSCLFHAGAALLVFAVGRRLYGPKAALAGATLYALMPGVQLSAGVAATDAPLLFFLGLNLLTYVRLQGAKGRARLAWAAAFGASLGLAFLSKYAAAYALFGALAHAAVSREARKAWGGGELALAAICLGLVMGPNVAWNISHGFSTLQHTAANAAWGGRQLFNPGELAGFLISQFGVFGPIPFAVVIGGAVLMARRGRLEPADLLLLAFTLPPLLIVAGQAFISRANANWSGAGYLAGAILAGAWLIRWGARRWLAAAIVFQGAAALLFLVWAAAPSTADAMGASNAFKRAKGWSQLAQAITDRIAEDPRAFTAVTVNSRLLYNAAAYYGRDYFARPGAPPLTMWLLGAGARNQAEATAPLTPALGRRVLAASLEQTYRDEMAQDFSAISDRRIIGVRLDPRHRRRMELFVGEGFRPRPRDPVSDLPIRP